LSPWIRIAFLALGAAVLLLLIAGADVAELRESVGGADRRLLGAAIVLLGLDIGLKAVRWRFMAAQLAQPPLSVWQAGISIVAGVAAASLAPARGIEFAKPLLLHRSRGVPLSRSTAAVVVERLLDGAGLIILFGVSLVLLPAGRAEVFRPLFIAIGFLVAAIGLALTVPSKLAVPLARIVSKLPLPESMRMRAARLVESFFRGMLLWRQQRQFWVVVALSVAASMTEALRLTVVFAAMNTPITVVQAMFTFSLANLVAVLTFIPGGVGITELSMAGIVRLIGSGGFAPAALTAAVLVDRVLGYYLVVVVGSLVLLAVGATRPRHQGTGAQNR
jgi:uncharacterized protein (TIRG00374 family)